MNKIKEFISKKNNNLIFILAIVGIALVFISSIDFDFSNKSKSRDVDYESELEKKVESVVCKITGERKVEVFITLESSEEIVYADKIKSSNNVTEDNQGDDKTKLNEKQDKEQNYIIIEDSQGGQQALVVTTLSPTVRGVVVVSNYADNEAVCESIVNAVTTALNISNKKVCVVGGNNI